MSSIDSLEKKIDQLLRSNANIEKNTAVSEHRIKSLESDRDDHHSRIKNLEGFLNQGRGVRWALLATTGALTAILAILSIMGQSVYQEIKQSPSPNQAIILHYLAQQITKENLSVNNNQQNDNKKKEK